MGFIKIKANEEGRNMWTKTRSELENRLAPCLSGRVRYQFEVFTSIKSLHWEEMPVFSIFVDGEYWFASDPRGHAEKMIILSEMIEQQQKKQPDKAYWELATRELDKVALEKAMKGSGHMYVDDVMRRVHIYLNEANIDDCLSGKDYFLYMLAIMDRRTGKRRIKKIVDNIEQEPLWIRKFIYLRAKEEKMIST